MFKKSKWKNTRSFSSHAPNRHHAIQDEATKKARSHSKRIEISVPPKFLNVDKIFRSLGEIDRDTRKSSKTKQLVSSHLERRPDLLK